MSFKAMVSMQNCFDCSFGFVQVLNNRMRITLSRSCINDNVVMFVHLFKEPVTIRTNVELKHVFAQFQSHVSILHVPDRVNQGLI